MVASALDEVRKYTTALQGVAKSARELDELLLRVDGNLTPVAEKLEQFEEVMLEGDRSPGRVAVHRGGRRRVLGCCIWLSADGLRPSLADRGLARFWPWKRFWGTEARWRPRNRSLPLIAHGFRGFLSASPCGSWLWYDFGQLYKRKPRQLTGVLVAFPGYNRRRGARPMHQSSNATKSYQ